MECVNDWCNNNHIVGNGDKRKPMLIITYQKESNLPKNKKLPFFVQQHTTAEYYIIQCYNMLVIFTYTDRRISNILTNYLFMQIKISK